MLSREKLEDVWERARHIDPVIPVTYCSLFGYERLAVLRTLDEPVQSTLHQVMQGNVTVGTPCVRKSCCGTLRKDGSCDQKCEQSEKNIVQDIMECRNCDATGFPCRNCIEDIFDHKLHEYMDY